MSFGMIGHRHFHCIHKSRWSSKRFEISFDSSNYELDRPLSKRKKKKAIGLMEYELGGKSWQCWIKSKKLLNRYDNSEDEKAMGTKKCDKMET